MAISKIIYKASASATPEVWMDATTATATAGDIISPKTAMLADGVVTQGTGSGGGIDMPTITVTWNDDMDTIVSVVCDKTFSECETYCNNGIYNCVLIQKDQSQTWTGQIFATWYDQASGTSADYIVWTAMNGTFPEFDIRYNYDNTFTTTVPSVQQITMNITTNGTHYPSGGVVQEVNVNVPTGTARSSSDLTASGLTVTAPAGLYASAASKTLSDANLTAGNIKKDVPIFGVTGTYEGGGGGGIQKTLTFTSVLTDTNYSSVTYNSITYDRTNITEGMTLNVTTGDKIYLYCNIGRIGCQINVDGVQVAYSEAVSIEYEYTVIDTDIEISFYSGANNGISINYPKLNITQNGTFNVSSYYYASVAVEGTAGADEIIQRTITGSYTNSTVSVIGSYAFYYCSGLTDVSFPNCTTISQIAFYYCSNLETVYAPNCAEIDGSAFYSCYALKEISFPNLSNFSNAGTFAYCSSLSAAYIPNVHTIGNFAFISCWRLSSLTIGSLYSVGNQTFQSCQLLPSITFNSSIVGGIGNSAFMNCYSLAGALNLPEVSGAIGSCAFMNCYKLTEVNIAVAKTISVNAFASCTRVQKVSIGFVSFSTAGFGYNSVFQYCTSLSSVYIGKCGTGSTRSQVLSRGYSIGSYWFLQCSSLSFVCFEQAATIYPYAFSSCRTLLSLYLLWSSTTITALSNINAFMSTPISTYTVMTGGINGSIYVRESLYSTYIAATNWVTYSSRFVSMTDAEIETFLSNLT